MTIIQKQKNSPNKTKNVIMFQTAANVNMLLNFGKNITDISLDKGVELHILYSKHQKNIIKDDLQSINAVFHKTTYKQEFSVTGLMNNAKSFIHIFWLLKKLKPDVVYTRGTFMGYIARPAALLAGVKNIYHHQDDFFHREENIGKIKRFSSKKIDLLLSKISMKLFFVRDTIVQEAYNIGINKNKCILVGHDLHPIFKNNINFEIKRKHQLIERYIKKAENLFIVGSIARIEDFKGIDTIIKVARQIKKNEKSIKFFIRGNGTKFEKYAEIIKSEQLTETVYLVNDYLPSHDMPSLFKSFDIFFLPTRREGFGMVFAEAMSMGISVICPKIHPVVGVVPDHLGWLIDPEDIEAYSNSILEIFNDPKKAKKKSLQAKRYALKRWGGASSGEKVVSTMLENTKLKDS